MTSSKIALLSGAWLGLAACAGTAPPPAATTPAVPAPVGAQTITPADMYARVAFLASDALRGRGTPSPGLEAAAAYLVSEYLKLGLAPAGEGGSYYQRYPYPLRSLTLEGIRLRLAAPGGIVDPVYGREYFVAGGTAQDVEAPLVFVGADIAAVGPGPLRDKIAVVLLPGDGASRDWRLARRQQRQRAEEAGALAVVFVLDPAWTAERIGAAAGAAATPARALGAEPGFPELYLAYDVASRIFAAGGVDLATAWREALAGTAKPTTLSGISATAAIPLTELDRALAPNVAAVLPGSDPELRDEFIVLSAHLDHVGVGRPVNGDSIYNGADDDASGTAALVEIAEAMASLPERPARSVIFLHVSGEEHGLLGSRWYSDHPTVPLEQVVANINIDMIGRNAPDSVVVIGKDYSSLGRVVNTVGAERPEIGLVVADDIWPEERFFFRSDHFNFARKEIPALFFFTGVHEDYHRPSDEVEKLNVGKAARVAQLIYHTVLAIADDPERPVWDPEGLAEVRALTR